MMSTTMNTKPAAQFPEEREQAVMDFLRQQGSIRIGDVVDMLGISPSTARLLLQKMQDKGMLKRTHGGAILNESQPEKNTSFSNIVNAEKKMQIAKAAAATIQDGDYISIGSGSTTFLLATLLHGKKDVTVVTDSIPIAYELLDDDGITLYICGGWIMKRNSACRGLSAERFFKDIKVDKSYNSADSINVNVGSTSIDFDPRTERAICHSGEKCYILADSTKFNRHPFIDSVVGIDEMDVVFTDAEIDQEYVRKMKDAGVEVVIG